MRKQARGYCKVLLKYTKLNYELKIITLLIKKTKNFLPLELTLELGATHEYFLWSTICDKMQISSLLQCFRVFSKHLPV